MSAKRLCWEASAAAQVLEARELAAAAPLGDPSPACSQGPDTAPSLEVLLLADMRVVSMEKGNMTFKPLAIFCLFVSVFVF